MNPNLLALPILALIVAGVITAIVIIAAPIFTLPRKQAIRIQKDESGDPEKPDLAGRVLERLNPANRRWAGR